jgi:hypothetical protein
VRGGPSVGRLDLFHEEAIEAAHADLGAAMEALMAFRRGDDSYEADAGAYLLAEALAALRRSGGLA